MVTKGGCTPLYYEQSCFGPRADGGQDNVRQPRHDLTDGWGHSRPPFPRKLAKFLYLIELITFHDFLVSWGHQESWVGLLVEDFPFHPCNKGSILTTYKKGFISPSSCDQLFYSNNDDYNSYPLICLGPCEPRPHNHGWGFHSHPVHHQNHFHRPCSGSVPVATRGLWLSMLYLSYFLYSLPPKDLFHLLIQICLLF